MNKRAVNISSLVILLSLLSFIAEVCVYYFIPYHWISVAFAGITSLAISHFCLESSLDYDYSFIHASFMVISSLAFAAIIYIIQPNQWIQYDFSMVFLVLVNWLVPFFYSCLRDLFDRGPRFDGYHSFFRRMSSLFIVVFLFTIIKQYFLTPIVPPYEEMPFGAHNFVPFMATATYIETALRNDLSLLPLFAYVAEIICMGIPIGFFCRIYCNKLMLFFRLVIYFAIPIFLEILQDAAGLGRGDIDDVALSLMGILIGVILFHIMNGVYQSVSNRDFMMSRIQNSKYFY